MYTHSKAAILMRKPWQFGTGSKHACVSLYATRDLNSVLVDGECCGIAEEDRWIGAKSNKLIPVDMCLRL